MRFHFVCRRLSVLIAGCFLLIATQYFDLYGNGMLKRFTTTKNARFLCLVLAKPARVPAQEAIIETWGSYCSDLIFLFGNATKNRLHERKPHVFNLELNVFDDFENTWLKVRAAFNFIKNNWAKHFDWLIRIDDDSYLIFENLKALLAQYQPSIPLQFGCHLLNYKGGYIQTGPGIVLSHAAFDSLMLIFDNNSLCNTTLMTHDDDVQLGKCLRNAGIPFGNSSGEPFGRPRFIMANLQKLVHTKPNDGTSEFFRNESAYPVGFGFDCCSEDLIGLHYLTVKDIRRFHEIIRMNPDKRKNSRLLVP